MAATSHRDSKGRAPTGKASKKAADKGKAVAATANGKQQPT